MSYPRFTTCHSAGEADDTEFQLTSDANFPPPAGFGPGWKVRYLGEVRTVLSWDAEAFVGTIDEAWAAPMEGGHDVDLALALTAYDARQYTRQFARNAGSSAEYADADVDRAVMTVLERFCRLTRCLSRADTATLTAADTAVDLTALGDGFDARRLVDAFAAGVACALRQVGYPELHRRAVECPRTGKPELIAFLDAQTAAVYPTPDAGYTLTLRWWEPFTVWAPGCSDTIAKGIFLNARRDHLIQILPWGPPPVLQHNEKEHAYATESWQKYLEFEQGFLGGGNLGERVSIQARPR